MIINETYFKKYSPIPLNYNMTEVKNYIPVAEKIWVKPLIGAPLFDEIDCQVKENNVSEENATLLTEGGLWQYLAFATVYEALPMIWSHISEVGVTKGKSDKHLRNQVEVLKEQLKKWICEHYLYYPKADVCACNCSCCCNNNPQLAKPNPDYKVYKPYNRNTNLK